MALGPVSALWPVIGLLVAQSSSSDSGTSPLILPQQMAANTTQCAQLCSSFSTCVNYTFDNTTNKCHLLSCGNDTSCQHNVEEKLSNSTGTSVNISTVAVKGGDSKSSGEVFSSTVAPRSKPTTKMEVSKTSHVTTPLVSARENPMATAAISPDLPATGASAARPPPITTPMTNSPMAAGTNITAKPPTIVPTTAMAKSPTTAAIPTKSLTTPNSTTKEPMKRLEVTTVNKASSSTSPKAPSTQTTSWASSRPATSQPKSSPGKDVRGPNKAILDITASSLTRQVADTSTLLAILMVGLLLFVVSVILFLTQAYESYRKKDYTQVDYLINGMYSDSGV